MGYLPFQTKKLEFTEREPQVLNLQRLATRRIYDLREEINELSDKILTLSIELSSDPYLPELQHLANERIELIKEEIWELHRLIFLDSIHNRLN